MALRRRQLAVLKNISQYLELVIAVVVGVLTIKKRPEAEETEHSGGYTCGSSR